MSLTSMSLTVTLPLFSTVIVYVITSPSTTSAPSLSLTFVISMVLSFGSVGSSFVPGVGSVGSSSGSVPFAVAVFFTLPARMSCSVTSCVNVAVAFSPGFSSVLSRFAVMSSGS